MSRWTKKELTEHTCPKCGAKFMRKFVKNPLCLKCQVDAQKRDGLSVEEIANIKAGKRLEKATAAQMKRQNKIELRDSERREKLNTIKKMRTEKKSLAEIGKAFGVSRQAIQQFLRAAQSLDT